jgi:hypothetical protein
MDNRRKFIKKAALGSVLMAGLPGLNNRVYAAGFQAAGLSNPDIEAQEPGVILPAEWSLDFDEKTAILTLKNGPLVLSGKLTFVSGDETWTVDRSRDGVPNRYALVAPTGDVQGYMVFIGKKEQGELLFYHRTAQAYSGVLSFTGEITFWDDAFPCHCLPKTGERVLSLSSGATASSLNDSLFSPARDCLLQVEAVHLQIGKSQNGRTPFSFSGKIEEAPEALLRIRIEADYFKNRYVPYYRPIDRMRCPKAPTGWMSWNTYFDKAGAEDNLNEAKIGAKYLLPFGCEFWSIESWQGNSDLLPVCDFYNMDLEVNEKQFPKGMKKLADDIRALGFRPGLWMAPFGTGNKAFYDAHKNWFLHYKNGSPIHSWNGQYTLDPTVKEAREHLKNIFRKASREWGYEFFKIDGMSGRNHGYCAHLYERPEVRACFKDPSCPNPFELCVQAFREGIGDDRVFLACQGHSSGAEAAYADASRLGADIVHPNEPVTWSNVLNQGRCLINQVFTHNIVMVADPDTLLVHDLPLEEARTSATIVALPGQLTFFGDKLAGLSGEQMKILQQTLPVADVLPVNLYPSFAILPVWNLRVSHEKLGDYNVVALFNWSDEVQTISATAAELGIDAAADYTGYEFWTEKAVPFDKNTGKIAVEVPAHSVRVVALHSLQTVPQWIGSDRHIAQTGMEITSCAWNPAGRALEGKMYLVGTFPLTMRLRVPPGYAYSNIACKGVTCTVKQEPENILAVTFHAKKSIEAAFEIAFT